MQKFYKIFVGLMCLFVFLSIATKVSAAAPLDCRCATDLDLVSSAVSLYKNQSKVLKSICVAAAAGECNISNQAKPLKIIKTTISPDCWKSTADECITKTNEWQVKFDIMLATGKKAAESSAKETPSGSSAISVNNLIQKCGLVNMDPACWDVTVFVSLLLDLTNYLFGIIGGLALGVFVYGGFVLIMSQGNPEKVKQGTGAMINAVIGLVVAFGGYVLVGYLGEILKLKSEFGLLK